MAESTEAACLLQSGAIYSRRLGMKTSTGEAIFLGVKPGAVSLYFGDAPIFHFDLEGRWQRAYLDGTHYLKGLDGSVRSIDRDREPSGLTLRRETLAYAETTDVDALVRSTALALLDDLDSGHATLLDPPANVRAFEAGEAREFLESVGHWDASAWFSHRERYLATYGRLPFLPPETPNALVLQATLGDREGRAFGGAKGDEHYVRDGREFLDHARAVARLLGGRVAQHRGIFLAGPDALRRPIGDVLDWLATIRKVFPTPGETPIGAAWDDQPADPGPVVAFLDDFSAPRLDPGDWQALREAGLARVTLGVESGDPAVRSGFGKSWEEGELRSTVRGLKAAGMGLGLVALVGAAGRTGSARHVGATGDLFGSLGLGRGDLVTLVDVRGLEEKPADDRPGLSDEETAEELSTLKAALASIGAKVVSYNPAKRRS